METGIPPGLLIRRVKSQVGLRLSFRPKVSQNQKEVGKALVASLIANGRLDNSASGEVMVRKILCLLGWCIPYYKYKPT